MKVQTISASAIIALALVIIGCGKDSNNKKSSIDPAPIPNNDSFFPEDQFGDNSDEFNGSCGQSQNGCNSDSDSPRLTIVSSQSWRYTNANQARITESPESCIQSLSSSSNGVDLKLRNMEVRAESDRSGASARCLMQAKVRYPKGYSFAIRRVRLTVDTTIRSGASASFQGSYSAVGSTSVEMSRSINKNGTSSIVIEKSLNSSEYAWSSCDGEGTLSVNTTLKLQRNATFSGVDPSSMGDITVSDEAPYRVEIVWAKCS